jgi:hypothetical protein
MNITSAAHAARLLPRQWMVPGKAAREYRGFVEEVGVEVFVAEAGLRCVKCGVGQVDAGRLHQHRRVVAGYLLGEPEVFGE